MALSGTILLVEDDPFLSELYATKFRLEGITVHTAADGEAGLAAAQSINPDLILLDILMPKMNGFEVLEKLKADPRTKDLPVILLTNLSQHKDIEAGKRLGAVDYLVKAHFMPSEVVEKIKPYLTVSHKKTVAKK